ncbi:MAG: xanthine dehydrogenase family protein molybdopterin-binding subunit [Alphaproteobacteria bacterium]
MIAPLVKTAANTGIGAPVRRKEDARLVVGGGCFSDDINQPDQLYAVIVRSPHGHARIRGISTAAAKARAGVVAVLTAQDARDDGVVAIEHPPPRIGPPDIQLEHRSGSNPDVLTQFPLAEEKVRFVGEAVAMVVAETVQAAKDAAEKVVVDYQPLVSVTNGLDAISPGAPKVFEGRESNLLVDADAGDPAAAAAAIAGAAHVVKFKTQIQRVTGVPMEPRAAVGTFDPATGRYEVHAGCGGVVRLKREVAAVLQADEEKVRIVARDIGGNFGTRNAIYPEFPLVAWAAKRLGRPVKWTCERSESFLSDHQGRDLAVDAELALDAEGNFLAIRSTNTFNAGAYPITYVPLIKGVELMSGVYAIPSAHIRARAVLSNKPPINNYRSSGRPEAMFVIERLIELAARQHGFDPVELRRRNLIDHLGEGYVNPLGLAYDCGAYERVMDDALVLGEWKSFPARRAEARGRGMYRGIGMSNYLEVTGGYPHERAEITIRPDRQIDVVIGTLSSGQGHETSFAQLLCEWLGVPIDCVNLLTGDTDFVKEGGGSHSARSMRLAGIVIGNATAEIKDKGCRIAAALLGAEPENIKFTDARFVLEGSNRSLDLFEVAAAAMDGDGVPDDLRGPFAAVSQETVRIGAFPYGCHVCEVEVDPETGFVAIVRYAAIDDVGRAINPLILGGQTHGGATQGIGQAMGENCVYDPATGQLLSGSFMDYPMPRAGDLPSFDTALSEVPSPRNPLGIRAGGEGGTTPALAVVINAIVDALADLGVTHVEMPATPERVWRTIRQAASAASN